MEFTGERYCPEVRGEIALEHRQRYLAARDLARGRDVLDVASGEGYGSAQLAYIARSVTGLEISFEAVKNAHDRYKASNLAFVQGDAACLPFGDASFDLVVSFETIEHLSAQDAMIGEIRRVLRPDGLLLISSPDRRVNEDRNGHNPYHVAELYEEEFEALIGRYFGAWKLLGQRMIFASVLAGTGTRPVWVDANGKMGDQLLPEPKYHVIIASVADRLPELPLSVMEGRLEEGELFAAKKAEFDRLMHAHKELGEAKARLDSDLGSLSEAHHQLEGSHARLNREIGMVRAESAARAEQIARLDKLVYEMTHSRSWRLTAPLRYSMHQARRFRTWLANAPHAFAATFKSRKPQAPVAQGRRIVLVSGESATPGHVYRMERLACALGPAWATGIFDAEQLEGPHFRLPDDTAIIWIWRARLAPAGLRLIRDAKAAGIRVIYDIDDMCFHPDHYTVANMDALRRPEHNMEAVRKSATEIFELCSEADLELAPTVPLMKELFDRTGKPALVMRNTFDHATRERSVVGRQHKKKDDLVRIGYAAGTLTHQADLASIAPALKRVLAENRQCRLVLFDAIDIAEIGDLQEVADQIEWRKRVPLAQLPDELARFDINIAPLEIGNKFCECKSELKFFESALVRVPTVASATRPFAACIANGKNGFIATSVEDWYASLGSLVRDAALRQRMGNAANRTAIWLFGPEYLRLNAGRIADYAVAGPDKKAELFNFLVNQETLDKTLPYFEVPDYEIVHRMGLPGARVAVVVPLYNYQDYITEALDSLLGQTMRAFDVIVVNDSSTDDSEARALAWLKEHGETFASATLLANRVNAGLAVTRNVGIDYSESEFIMLLDADNKLLPQCIEKCVQALSATDAAFVYPALRRFGDADTVFSDAPWDPLVLRHGNYIDAMVMMRKACWAAVGGYTDQRGGWEDYDLWCKFMERGFRGEPVDNVLALYRVHGESMLHTSTDVAEVKKRIKREMAERHGWLHFGQ